MQDLEQNPIKQRTTTEVFSYHGKEILYVNFSEYNIVREKTILVSSISEAINKIKTYPEKSLLLLTDFTGTRFDKDIATCAKNYSMDITPYVKSSAVVGVSGIQLVLAKTVQKLTGRTFFMAKSIEEAKEWLIAQ